MNAVCASGYTTRTAPNGANALRFTIVARHGYNAKEGKELTEFVPCLLFKPSEKLRELLSKEGVFVELRGRISNSKYEKNGETRYSTQVVVDPMSLNIIK